MTTVSFERDLPGGGGPAAWGFDAVMECYWARTAVRAAGGHAVEIGTEHLITTLPGLARALALALSIDPGDAYLALTAPAPAEAGGTVPT